MSNSEINHDHSNIIGENILTHLSVGHHHSSPRENDHLQPHHHDDESPTHAKTPIRRLNTAKNVAKSLSSVNDNDDGDEEFLLNSPPGKYPGGSSTTTAPPLSPDNNQNGKSIAETQNSNNVSCVSNESTPHRQDVFPVRNLQFRRKSTSDHHHHHDHNGSNNNNNFHLLQQLGHVSLISPSSQTNHNNKKTNLDDITHNGNDNDDAVDENDDKNNNSNNRYRFKNIHRNSYTKFDFEGAKVFDFAASNSGHNNNSSSSRSSSSKQEGTSSSNNSGSLLGNINNNSNDNVVIVTKNSGSSFGAGPNHNNNKLLLGPTTTLFLPAALQIAESSDDYPPPPPFLADESKNNNNNFQANNNSISRSDSSNNNNYKRQRSLSQNNSVSNRSSKENTINNKNDPREQSVDRNNNNNNNNSNALVGVVSDSFLQQMNSAEFVSMNSGNFLIMNHQNSNNNNNTARSVSPFNSVKNNSSSNIQTQNQNQKNHLMFFVPTIQSPQLRGTISNMYNSPSTSSHSPDRDNNNKNQQQHQPLSPRILMMNASNLSNNQELLYLNSFPTSPQNQLRQRSCTSFANHSANSDEFMKNYSRSPNNINRNFRSTSPPTTPESVFNSEPPVKEKAALMKYRHERIRRQREIEELKRLHRQNRDSNERDLVAAALNIQRIQARHFGLLPEFYDCEYDSDNPKYDTDDLAFTSSDGYYNRINYFYEKDESGVEHRKRRKLTRENVQIALNKREKEKLERKSKRVSFHSFGDYNSDSDLQSDEDEVARRSTSYYNKGVFNPTTTPFFFEKQDWICCRQRRTTLPDGTLDPTDTCCFVPRFLHRFVYRSFSDLISENRAFIRLLIPSMAIQFLRNFISVLAFGFAARLLDKRHLAGFVVGFSFTNIVGIAIGMGLSSALDSLCSHSFGRHGFSVELGIHLRTAYFFAALYAVVYFAFSFFAGHYLVGFLKPQLADSAAAFLIPSVVQVFGTTCVSATHKFLNAQHRTHIAFKGYIIGSFVSIVMAACLYWAALNTNWFPDPYVSSSNHQNNNHTFTPSPPHYSYWTNHPISMKPTSSSVSPDENNNAKVIVVGSPMENGQIRIIFVLCLIIGVGRLVSGISMFLIAVTRDPDVHFVWTGNVMKTTKSNMIISPIENSNSNNNLEDEDEDDTPEHGGDLFNNNSCVEMKNKKLSSKKSATTAMTNDDDENDDDVAVLIENQNNDEDDENEPDNQKQYDYGYYPDDCEDNEQKTRLQNKQQQKGDDEEMVEIRRSMRSVVPENNNNNQLGFIIQVPKSNNDTKNNKNNHELSDIEIVDSSSEDNDDKNKSTTSTYGDQDNLLASFNKEEKEKSETFSAKNKNNQMVDEDDENETSLKRRQYQLQQQQNRRRSSSTRLELSSSSFQKPPPKNNGDDVEKNANDENNSMNESFFSNTTADDDEQKMLPKHKNSTQPHQHRQQQQQQGTRPRRSSLLPKSKEDDGKVLDLNSNVNNNNAVTTSNDYDDNADSLSSLPSPSPPTCCSLWSEALVPSRLWSYLGLAWSCILSSCADRWIMEILAMYLTTSIYDDATIDLWGVLTTIWIFLFPPSVGCYVAASTLVGQAMGGGRPGRARFLAWRILTWAAILCGVTNGLYIVFARHVATVFTSDEKLQSDVRHYAPLFGLCSFLDSMQFVFQGIYRAVNKAKFNSFVMIGGQFLICLPIATVLVLPFKMGIFACGACLAGTNFLICLVFWIGLVFLTPDRWKIISGNQNPQLRIISKNRKAENEKIDPLLNPVVDLLTTSTTTTACGSSPISPGVSPLEIERREQKSKRKQQQDGTNASSSRRKKKQQQRQVSVADAVVVAGATEAISRAGSLRSNNNNIAEEFSDQNHKRNPVGVQNASIISGNGLPRLVLSSSSGNNFNSDVQNHHDDDNENCSSSSSSDDDHATRKSIVHRVPPRIMRLYEETDKYEWERSLWGDDESPEMFDFEETIKMIQERQQQQQQFELEQEQ